MEIKNFFLIDVFYPYLNELDYEYIIKDYLSNFPKREVIKRLQQVPFQIPIKRLNRDFLFWNSKFYKISAGYSHMQVGLRYDVTILREFNPCEFEPEAIQSLLSVVKGDLTLPDKSIIKNIAIKSYNKVLEDLVKLGDKEDSFYLRDCVCTRTHERALNELKALGYQIKK